MREWREDNVYIIILVRLVCYGSSGTVGFGVWGCGMRYPVVVLEGFGDERVDEEGEFLFCGWHFEAIFYYVAFGLEGCVWVDGWLMLVVVSR